MTFNPYTDLAGLDEPVRRYFERALAPGAAAPQTVELRMSGRINPGLTMGFDAVQLFTGHAFTWEARAGWGRVRPLRVVDRYDGAGGGGTAGHVFGRWRFLHADDADSGRAAAGRAAAESIWLPWLLLPSHGVRWQVVDEGHIRATLDVPPETVQLTLGIDAQGRVRTVSLPRWGNVGRSGYGYIPFGGDVLAERAFGGWTIPSHLRVGWWYGTARYKPFFDATIDAMVGRS